MGLAERVNEYSAEDYWALPEDVHAELIDGQLWDLAAPSTTHQRIVMSLAYSMQAHIKAHNGLCEVFPAPFAVNLFVDDSTFVEPDISVVCDRSKLSERGCEGAPDFVAEVVSPSNPGMDYVTKLNLYREAGVREYWICDPMKRRVLTYTFDSEDLMALYGFDIPVRSTVFPDFEIDFSAIR